MAAAEPSGEVVAPFVQVIVPGLPITQGSVKTIRHRHTGRRVTIHDNPDLPAWRDTIAWHANLARSAAGWHPDPDAAYTVTGCAWVPRPRSHYGTGRNTTRVLPSAPPLPTRQGTGDVDKILRAILDALTDAGMWRNDAQVTDTEWRKRWATPTRPPGVLITVQPTDPDTGDIP